MFSDGDPSWIKPLAFSLFAAIGGLMGYLMRSIHGQEKINLGRGMVEMGSAGFVGFLILLLCQAMGLSEAWTGVVVGVSGWLGANVTIQILERLVRKKLGVDNTESTDADKPQ